MVDILNVPGLSLLDTAINEEREAELVTWIAELAPEPHARRARLDLYGGGAFVATSIGRKVSPTIPPILAQLAGDLFDLEFDAITVSEYLPGQGVAPHVDRLEAGRVIRTLGLLADGELVFRAGRAAVPVPFPRRSVAVISGACRSLPWTHELSPVKERRLSIAFRGAQQPRV